MGINERRNRRAGSSGEESGITFGVGTQAMSNEINIDGSDNIVIQGIGEGAQVEVTKILAKSYEYNDLLDKLKTKQELFDLQPEENTERRLQLSAEINRQTDIIEQFKRDVLALAEAFGKIEINTDRLRRAKEFFYKGEFGEARAVFAMEIEEMQDNHSRLMEKKNEYERDTLPKLKHNSEEFYIAAMSAKSDYTNPNRFEDTCRYFELSIEAAATRDNLFNYAFFLDEHNQITKSANYYSQLLNNLPIKLSLRDKSTIINNLGLAHLKQHKYDAASKEFEETLQIRRNLVKESPNTYLSDVATTLNNLAALHFRNKEYEKALKEYEEALEIRRNLAKNNPNGYSRDVANTLNNLAALHIAQDEYEKAMKEHKEALQIYRNLANIHPNVYLRDVAFTLNNQANLYFRQNDYEKALKGHEEAMKIYQNLSENNPEAHLPELANTILDLAYLHYYQNEFEKSAQKYEEGLKIFQNLANDNPNVYLRDVASALHNLANLHYQQNSYQKALRKYEEALKIRKNLAKDNPNVYLEDFATTLGGLADLHREQNEYEKALEEYKESLQIHRNLAKVKSNRSLLNVAVALNNLALCYEEQDEYEKATKEYEESLKICRTLYELVPHVYAPYLATALSNIARCYQLRISYREKSIECAVETAVIFAPIVGKVPHWERSFQNAIEVLKDWGLNEEEIEELIAQKMKESEQN